MNVVEWVLWIGLACLCIGLFLRSVVGPHRDPMRVPPGLCMVELLGRQRIRGTVRARWLGAIPWLEVTSAEPGHEGELEGPFGHGAVFRLRALTDDEKRWLENDRRAHRERITEALEEAEKRRTERARMIADAPRHTHAEGCDEKTWCGVPAAGLRVSEKDYDCPYCKDAGDDIPF